MRALDAIVAVLLIVGGLNWGLVGVFNFDLVAAIFGAGTALSRIVYAIVGLCAVYWLVEWGAIRRRYGEMAPGGRAAPTPT
ncbi:MAG: DUF378 domain-containing protein [Armatimonadetes bacterium]|nr:DUF378 domain-containing protein [Armatimonadota bacterium]